MMTWHDRLCSVLEQLSTERLTLLRDLVSALIERRRAYESVGYADLATALSSYAQAQPQRSPPK